jgi:uncharacterized protein (DUF934 family)
MASLSARLDRSRVSQPEPPVSTLRFVDGASPVDLVLANDVDVESIVDRLADLASIGLVFPKWTDGRAYSQARLLRARHRFAGEIRATGEVLADMMPLLLRCGFDAVQLRADQSQAVAERALAFFPQGHYQGDLGAQLPRYRRRKETSA